MDIHRRLIATFALAAKSALVALLGLGPPSPAYAGQIFFSSFLATEDGIPFQRLDPDHFESEIRALALDPDENVLYIIRKNQGSAVGFTIALDTGVISGPFSIALPLSDDGVGLAFDTNRHALYMIVPHVLCEIDSNFQVRSCSSTAPDLFIVDAASLAYDPHLDAFWVLRHTFAPFLHLINHSGEVIDVINTSPFLLEDEEGMVSLDLDSDDGTILIETRISISRSGQLLRVSREGALLERINIPRKPHIDSAMAWSPLDPSLPSNVLARVGLLEDPFVFSVQEPALYTPLPGLFVNSSSGNGRREVTVAQGTPLDLFIDRPPLFNTDPDPIPFLLYAYPGETSELSRFMFCPGPFLQEIGVSVFPLPFSSGDSTKTTLIVNATGRSSLGQGLFSTTPAPVTLSFPNGVSRMRRVTLQPLYVRRPTYARLGNAIVLSIE